MTLPNGIAGVSDAIGDLFAITGDPSLISSGNWGVSSISSLPALTQTFVTDLLKANVVQASNAWNAATADVWAGLRRGDPFGGAVSLPLAIIEQMVSQLLGLPPGTWESVEHALAAIEGLPGIAQAIQIITQAPGAIVDYTTLLTTWATNLYYFFGGIDLLDPALDMVSALASWVTANVIPYITSLPASVITTGTLLASAIPGLDASKIISGVLSGGLIPNLPASIINSGTFGSGLIPGLDASKIISGVLGTGFIPNLAASKITSGTFTTGLIPALDASKITTGQFPQSMLNITSIAANLVTGALTAANIPGLDVSKIITGTFGTSFIPSLDVSKITTGIFGAGFIPGLDTSKIISGTFANAFSPGLLPQAGGVSAASNNLVISPDFEDSTITRTRVTNLGGTGGYTTAQKRSGTQSFRMTTTSSGGQNDYFFLSSHTLGGESSFTPASAIKVQPGQWFYAEIYALKDAANTTTTGSVTLAIQLVDSTAVNTTTYVPLTGATIGQAALSSSTWTKISGWLQIPAGYDLGWPFLWINGGNVNAQTFYFDNARVTEDTQAQNVTQQLWGGSSILSTILATRVPGLDASKIISGVLSGTLIPNLAASIITSGTFGAAQIPGLDVSKIITGTFGTSFIPALDVSKITTGVFGAGFIPSLDVSKITTGIFGAGFIPGLDASKIITGTFATGFIPNLAASKITSGVFPATMLDLSSIAASAVSGTLTAANIPGLDVSKIITGTFGTGFIPNLDVAKITTGVFGSGFIPSLDASKITTGVLGLTTIPGMPTSKITSGTFLSTFFPAFNYKLSSGSNLVLDPSFENATMWASTLNANVQIVNTRAHTGTYSMKTTGAQAWHLATSDGGINQWKTRPGEKFRVGAWIWPEAANAGTGQVLFQFNCYQADATTISGFVDSPNYASLTKGQWNYVETVLTMPANSYWFYPYFYTPGVPATDIYYTDDVLIREETTTQSVIQQLFGGTSVLTSILSGVVPGLDASKIITGVLGTGIIPQLPISQITTLPGQLATMFSPFNPPQAIGTGQVTSVVQNLLLNPTFADPNSMLGETVWAWDAATPDGIGGSAKVLANANANAKSLLSNPVQVVAGDTVNVSAYTQWNSLVYTGTPISLMLNVYDANNTLITAVPLQAATMTGATSSWVQLIGTHIITETGAAWVRLRFDVSTAATAGSVWFGKATLTKPNLVPQSAVSGLPSLATIPGEIIDTGVQAIVNDASLINQSLAAFNAQVSNLARFLGYVTSGAAPTNSVAQIASAVDTTVKARAVQKAFNENIDPTSDAVFPLSQVWQNATLPTVACTAGATVMGDITVRDGGDKNAVTWYGYPTSGAYTNITDFRVNVYSVDKTTNVRTKVHGSINLIGSATPPGTGASPVFNSYNLPAAISNVPGDRLTAEIAILGSGTYNVVGQTISGQIPFHSVYGLHGLTRASATAPTTINPPGVGGSPLSYSRAIPWIGMSGTQSATQYTPVIVPFYSSGSFNPALYTWANYLDIVVCGPGGRGADGSGYWGGFAGHEGAWGAATLSKAQWFGKTITANITGGQSQAASSVSVSGWGSVVGPGGANEAGVSGTNNMGQYPAGAPGDLYYNGTNYPGGAGGAAPQDSGHQPGGAGAGGNAPWTVGTNIYGGNGGDGIAYIKAYQ